MTIVLYGSKYGSTKQYAEWIAEELNADLLDVNDAKIQNTEQYDTIIFGGAVYAGGIKGINFIVKNYDQLKNDKLIIFTCGIADPSVDINRENLIKNVKKISGCFCRRIRFISSQRRNGLLKNELSA